ncbi:hypothetical protein PFISCL1PPCAC_19956 [Pristionchus fissidentatus]|uniref:Uncharacterized protein n=1 Tax=Pristionchus fissidentatus TaxID=1538716 RepID=A0AAV5WFQ4_9BILA|nr:hypothetical protein PFISCL1PPCAC_19956 [Pristionchus fissidentatus]
MAEDALADVLHEELLSVITSGKLKKKSVEKSIDDVGTGELLNAIKSTKNVKKSRDSLNARKAKIATHNPHKTLNAPLHRSEVEKIQRKIGFEGLEKDLKVWEPVVSEHVHANNLQFPLNRETFTIDTAATRNEGFVARTPLEKAMDAVLATSKCNLSNHQEYTKDEIDIIKAMNVIEAKEKLSKLRRLRSLQSYQEAKFRRQKKIKSKNYHRIMKRAMRREELKELDELLIRDPEAARAKLEELDKDRVYERATLKHRAQNKMSKILARHASNDPNAKRVMDDHIRLGKEMKEKLGFESEEEDDVDNEYGEVTGDVVQTVVDEVEKEEMDEEVVKERIKKMRMEKRNATDKERGEGRKIAIVELVPFEEVGAKEKTKKRKALKDARTEVSSKKVKGLKEGEEMVEVDVEDMFHEVEKRITKTGSNVEMKKGREKKKDQREETKTNTGREKVNANEKKNDEKDLMLDPNNYLVVETSKMMQVGPDMDGGNDLIDDNAIHMGAAFVDDDVLSKFMDEKDEIEEAEKEKDMDLTLLGWGSWTGPGMPNSKTNKKFVMKAKSKERKDKGKVGLIISEKRVTSMDALQPKTVPFPFNRMEDYEATLSQPLGKEWNSLSSHSSLIKPTVSTQGGRVILPMSKNDILKTRMQNADER